MGMLKYLAIAAVVVILIFTGVVSVAVHTDKIKDVPGKLLSLVSDKSLRSKAETIFLSFKRTGEQWLVKDDDKKIRLALGYAKADAEKVQELLKDEAKADAAAVVPWANLLAQSTGQVNEFMKKAPMDTLKEAHDEIRSAFAAINDARGKLAALKEQAEKTSGELAAAADALEEKISALQGTAKPSTVAGSRDDKESNASPVSSSTPKPSFSVIPLSF